MNVDDPITSADQDIFGRKTLAEGIAVDFTAARGGLVAALLGPWGSGKTSLLNLVRSQLGDSSGSVVVLEFNPWFFSGTQQLVEAFLGQLSSQLASRGDQQLTDIANRLDAYKRVLEPAASLPIIGRFAKIGAAASSLGSALARGSMKFGSGNLQAERRAVGDALRATDRQFVVFIDDIDRLEAPEIRDLVRLVRLVGDFPKVSYLLAFDRERVERALGDGDRELGRDYLEKILQVSYLLPSPSRSQLVRYTFQTVDETISGTEVRELDPRYWGNVSTLVVEPLIRTPRDAKRYANALPSTFRAIGLEVNPADILALEALRVLLPQTFDGLTRLAPALTYVESGHFGGGGRLEQAQRDEWRTAIDSLITEAGDRGHAVRELLRVVFPASEAFTGNTHYGPDSAKQWRRERRVANSEVFAIYLARAIPEDGVPTALVEMLASGLSDADIVGSVFEQLPSRLVEPLLDRLEDFQEDFPHDPVEPLIAVSNLRPRVDHRRVGFFGVGAEVRIDRVIVRLLRRVETEMARDSAVASAFGRIGTLSAKLQLLLVAGHQENVGQEFISRSVEEDLQSTLRREITAASPAYLAQERDLARLLSLLRKGEVPSELEALRHLLDRDDVLIGLLRSSLSHAESNTVGEVTVQREAVLPWAWLEQLLSPAQIAERVRNLTIPLELQGNAIIVEAVETARKYADGWRPEWDRRFSVARASKADGREPVG